METIKPAIYIGRKPHANLSYGMTGHLYSHPAGWASLFVRDGCCIAFIVDMADIYLPK
jgi:hypothetical protein